MKKLDIYEWMCYLVLGTFVLFVVYSIAITIVTAPFPIFVGIPVCIVNSIAMVQLYIFFEKMYKGESFLWNSLYNNIKFVFCGCLLIVGLFCLSIGVLYLLGCYEVDTVQFNYKNLLDFFFIFMVVAVAEEIIFRGIIFRLIRDRWNLGVALIVSSLLFGFVHQLNDNATVWSSVSIAITSGSLLGITYEYYRTIWVSIGMHWVWNFVEGCVFGCSVSGYNELVPIIKPIIRGNVYLTGGEFGPEASIIVVVFGTIISVTYFILCRNSKK